MMEVLLSVDRNLILKENPSPTVSSKNSVNAAQFGRMIVKVEQ